MFSMKNLETLGYCEWFDDWVDASLLEKYELARVVSVHKGSCVVSKGDGDVFAKMAGSLFHKADSTLEIPTTGDWVYVQFKEGAQASVRSVLPRKSLLQRKTPGKRINYQLIAANIDVAFIVQAVDCNLNLRRIERYLVMVNESNIKPIILLSKCDLASPEKIEEIKKNILAIAPNTELVTFSNFDDENIQKIKESLVPTKTYCVIGVSGVGKSTLINNVVGEEVFETQEVREGDNKGRHTTTSRELVVLDNGAILIDTPGMRELAQMSVEKGLDETFSEIVELTNYCKFNNCSHSNEKGCAVLAAIDEGTLSQKRYENFLKMKKESEFHGMSYSQKKNKDKALAKKIKSVKKSRKNKYR